MGKINIYIAFICCQVLFFVSPTLAQNNAGSEWQCNNKKVSITYSDSAMVEMFMCDNELGFDTGTKYFLYL